MWRTTESHSAVVWKSSGHIQILAPSALPFVSFSFHSKTDHSFICYKLSFLCNIPDTYEQCAPYSPISVSSLHLFTWVWLREKVRERAEDVGLEPRHQHTDFNTTQPIRERREREGGEERGGRGERERGEMSGEGRGERRGERTGRSCGPEALTTTHRLQHCPAHKGEGEGRGVGGEKRGVDREKLWAWSLDPSTQTSTLPSRQGTSRRERTERSVGLPPRSGEDSEHQLCPCTWASEAKEILMYKRMKNTKLVQ